MKASRRDNGGAIINAQLGLAARLASPRFVNHAEGILFQAIAKFFGSCIHPPGRNS
jgi:hypothetical protein